MIYLNRDSNSMTISTFYELHMLNKFDYDPPCQRKSVWGEEQKSFLIDSLMKNFPIPPIFLYRKINSDTGKEYYDVIDGKQRLLSIIGFIENQIALPDDFGDGIFGDEKLNGMHFNDLKDQKAMFWKYKITIEYIESDEIDIINSVFDRLNRNGVTLNYQELRKAKYNASDLYKFILSLKEHSFWKESLKNGVKSNRLEDDEFISDILFFLIDKQIINSKREMLDNLYSKYYNLEAVNYNEIEKKFNDASNNLEKLKLDINKYKIYGVSHLYTLWNLAVYCIEQEIDLIAFKENIDEFYRLFRDNDSNEFIIRYKEGMARDVKSKGKRELRFKSIKEYLKL